MAILLNNATQAGAVTAQPYRAIGVHRSFQVVLSGSGPVSAVIAVEATNDSDSSGNARNFLPPIGTIELSGNLSGGAVLTDGFPSNTNWMFLRMRVVSISGTNASVYGGVEVS